jgi:DNA-binding IclR family transcriptional regulator
MTAVTSVKPSKTKASKPGKRREADGAVSVDRALHALLAFREGDAGLTLGEISRRTGLYKSTLLRLLASLERQRFVSRLSDGRYSLGPTLFRLGALYERALDVRATVEPVLVQLTTETGESSSLYVRERDHRLCLIRINSKHNVREHFSAGTLLPVDRGAAGRVLTRYESGPGADRGPALLAVTIGERDPELAAVAAPIFDRNSQLVGAICVAGTVTRFRDENLMARTRAAVLIGARDVTAMLGGPVEWFAERSALGDSSSS